MAKPYRFEKLAQVETMKQNSERLRKERESGVRNQKDQPEIVIQHLETIVESK